MTNTPRTIPTPPSCALLRTVKDRPGLPLINLHPYSLTQHAVTAGWIRPQGKGWALTQAGIDGLANYGGGL